MAKKIQKKSVEHQNAFTEWTNRLIKLSNEANKVKNVHWKSLPSKSKVAKKSYQLSICEMFPSGKKELCITVGDKTIAIPENEIKNFFEDMDKLKDKIRNEITTTRTGVGTYVIKADGPKILDVPIEVKVYK